MNCKNCGAKFEDDICPYCGIQQIETDKSSNQRNVILENISIKLSKKPIYRKKWFWVIAVLIFLCIIGSSGEDAKINNDITETANNLTTSIETTIMSTELNNKNEQEISSIVETTDISNRTFEVARKFVELYNKKLEENILNTVEFITEDRILKYDGAYAIQGNVDNKYILIMNFGSYDIKDKLRIEMYVDSPEEVFKVLSNVSEVITKPLTEDECNKTKQYLNECFTHEYRQYTEWTAINSIRYWAGYNGVGNNYEVLIEFSIDTFYK